MAIDTLTKHIEESGKWGKDSREYTETYTAIHESGDNPSALFRDLRSNFNLYIGLPYDLTYLTDISINRISNTASVVECSYKTLTPQEKEKATEPDPYSRATILSYATRETEEIFEKDQDDEPVVNSAGDPFQPGVVRRKGQGVITAVKNMENPINASAYLFKRNADTLFGYGTGELLCVSLSQQQQTETQTNDDDEEVEITYWQVTFEFEIDANQHEVEIADAGFREWKEVDGEMVLVKILDDFGEPVTEPRFLSSTGTAKDPGPDTDPDYLTFDVYPETSFGGLGL
ncbi:hypothetical protein GC163_12595 [bacterium]|nr:hypothetical protein [bacterium]